MKRTYGQARGREENGVAMVTVILIGMVITALATLLFTTTASELGRSGQALRRSAAFQAAEAGVDDYIAKLTEDRLYYAHRVHPAESTRRAPNGAVASAGQQWTSDLAWTYPNGKHAWRALGNGYEYNLLVTPPTTGVGAVRILATGRRAGSSAEWRAVETLVRPSSVADFQMVANRDITYGSAATTQGKLYAGIDENGTAHNITHYGTAYADIYAENAIPRQPTYRDGARGYSKADIRTTIRNPINFNTFTGSLVDIQRVAQGNGVYLNDTSVNGWRLVFNADGTVNVSRCTRRGAHLADRVPACIASGAYPVPPSGAIYAGQSAIVSGTVKGRVTVASNADIVIADNINYSSPGIDVLGLIARADMIVARWTPNNLNWRAATIAQTGSWRSYTTDNSHDTMTFTGSTATNLGGYMNMFRNRTYNYDPTLIYLAPPYFPVLEEAYTILFFRELPPSRT